MGKVSKKCIVLVDWYNAGHHSTFFNYFLVAFEELGYDVIALCPDPLAAERLAKDTRPDFSLDSRQRGHTRFFQIAESKARMSWLRPRRIGAVYSAIRRFRDLEMQIKGVARKYDVKTGAIFYACIYDREFDWIRFAIPFLKIPWTGLYLQAQSYRMPGRFRPGTKSAPRPERIFSSRICKGLGILDEGIVEQVSKHLGKKVVKLPDLACARGEASESDYDLVHRLKTFAAGRPIVGLFGHLQKSKGMLMFLNAAKLAGANDICFALAGEVLWPADEREAGHAREAIAECPNVWSHLERIPSESAFGQLIQACDVLAAAYVDFPHSSNIMGKAAVFEKPVIVSEGYLMAERVRKFRTGEVVNQSDAVGFLHAVRGIINDPAEWRRSKCPLWKEYRDENSFVKLKEGLEALMGPLFGHEADSKEPYA